MTYTPRLISYISLTFQHIFLTVSIGKRYFCCCNIKSSARNHTWLRKSQLEIFYSTKKTSLYIGGQRGQCILFSVVSTKPAVVPAYMQSRLEFGETEIQYLPTSQAICDKIWTVSAAELWTRFKYSTTDLKILKPIVRNVIKSIYQIILIWHCKDTIPKIWNKYSQFPHSCVCERFLYSHDRCLFCCRIIFGPILGI